MTDGSSPGLERVQIVKVTFGRARLHRSAAACKFSFQLQEYRRCIARVKIKS